MGSQVRILSPRPATNIFSFLYIRVRNLKKDDVGKTTLAGFGSLDKPGNRDKVRDDQSLATLAIVFIGKPI